MAARDYSAGREAQGATAALTTLAAGPAAAAPKLQTAVFAGGCFWCMENDMKAIPGVAAVDSGYTGGTLQNPHYEDVITDKTGHYESVRVRFDPAQITYRQLLDQGEGIDRRAPGHGRRYAEFLRL